MWFRHSLGKYTLCKLLYKVNLGYKQIRTSFNMLYNLVVANSKSYLADIYKISPAIHNNLPISNQNIIHNSQNY